MRSFVLLLVMAACSADETVKSPFGDGGVRPLECEVLDETRIGAADSGELGFAAVDALPFLEEEVSLSVTYVNGEKSTGTLTIVPDEPLVISLTRFSVPVECPPVMWVDGRVYLSTADGRFDEELVTRISLISPNYYGWEVRLPTDALRGGFEFGDVWSDPNSPFLTAELREYRYTLQRKESNVAGILEAIYTDSLNPEGAPTGGLITLVAFQEAEVE